MSSGILDASTLYGVEWYCNREYPKSQNSVTDKQTDRHTDGKPPIRVLISEKKRKMEFDVRCRVGFLMRARCMVLNGIVIANTRNLGIA